jgi:CTD small phosphatase-like protein 2
MDETLIHCVDDPDQEETDVILEIDFGEDGIVLAGVNIRPFINECLHQASKDYMIIVFTASHQVYADAILDYLDPKR